MSANSFKYKIKAHHGAISSKEGYYKELNSISWSGREAIYDLRNWHKNEDQRKPLKGITMNKEEIIALRDILNNLDLE